MADTRASAGLTVQQWDDQFFVEYVQDSLFAPYMGEGANSLIQVKNDLTKKQGDSLTYSLVNRLTNDGVTGSAVLEGNEEDMVSRSFRVYVDKIRNGVRIAEMDEQRSSLELRMAARDSLKTWIMEHTRDEVILAMGSINGVNYADASEVQKDAWLVDNNDRVLFGAARGNNAANDHSAALAEIDTTNDRATAGRMALLKRLALGANPKIRPLEVSGGKRVYVAFCGLRTFRDLQSSLEAVNRDALERGRENPIFSGADLYYDGIVFKQVDDIPVLTGVGNSGSDVSPIYLCGAQAIAMAWAKRTKSVTESFDYGDKFGVAIEEIRGIEKMIFGSGAADTDDLKQHGICTGYFSAPADA